MKLQFPTLPVAAIVAFSISAVLSRHLAIQATSASTPEEVVLSGRTVKVSASSLPQLENQRQALHRVQQFSLTQIKNLVSSPDSSLVSGSSAWLLRAIAQERWAEEDPASYLDWCLARDFPYHDPNLKDIIGEQPDLISTFLRSKKPLDARIRLFSTIAGFDPDFALQELPALLTTNTTDLRNLYYPLYNLGKTRMADLEALLKNLGPKHRSPLVDAVFTNKLQSNFAEGFQELLARPNGYEILFHSHFHDHPANGTKLKNALGDLPESWRSRIAKSPNALFNALGMNQDRLNIDWQELGFSEDQTNSIRSYFLKGEALAKPASAFALLNDYEFTGEEKRAIFQNALERRRTDDEWSQTREQLDDPADQALFDELAVAHATLSAQKIQNSDDLFNAAIAHEIPNNLYAMRDWDQLAQDSFHQRFANADPEVKTHLAEIAVANNKVIPSRFLGAALDHLLLSPGQPTPDQWPSGFGDFGPSHIVAQHAINLLESDPRDAQAWLNKLPEGQIRQEAIQNAALHWSNFDPTASEAWVQSMAEAERKRVSEFLKSYRSR